MINRIYPERINIKVVVFYTLMIFSVSLSGQWFQQHPYPGSFDLMSVCYADENNGWASSFDGTIIHTQDGGIT